MDFSEFKWRRLMVADPKH